MKWLAVFLVVIPTAVLADCEDPKIKEVKVRLQNVSWTGTWDPSCLQGFEVCWIPTDTNKKSCNMTSTDATSFLINDVDICVIFNVQVTAVVTGNLNLTNYSLTAIGDASPKLTSVRVELPNVSWTGTYEIECLRSFQVCWSHTYENDVSCSKVSPESTSMLIDDIQPCSSLGVEVTAITKGNLKNSMHGGSGHKGPPKMSGLRTTQQRRDVMTFEWSSLKNYTCVSNVLLWLCDNKTQDRRTCFHEQLSGETVRFELYDFPVCRQYYAYMCAKGIDPCDMTSHRVYIDSANELTRAEAVNITHNSAVMKWWVSDVNFTCKTEKIRVCYQEKSNISSPDCHSWNVDQVVPSDSITLAALKPCTTYSTVISLRSVMKTSSQIVTFTTSMTVDALKAEARNVTDTSAMVAWFFNTDRTDCETDSMQVCYAVSGNDATWLCRSVGTAAHSSARLPNLATCTTYQVTLMLLTASSPKPTTTLQFTTLSTGHTVLESMTTTSVGSTVRVDWSMARTSLQCISYFNVSWYSSDEPRITWQVSSSDATTFTIYAVTSGQTYYVQLAAVFIDGGDESLFQHVDVPAVSGSPVPFNSRIIFNITALLIVFFTYCH